MKNRHDLSIFLHELGAVPDDNIYFEPPENTKIKYPALIYELSNMPTKFADNNPYNVKHSYTVTYITNNPDSEYIDILANLMKFDRVFVSDDMYHYVYSIYY
jgi:hypothetical protein